MQIDIQARGFTLTPGLRDHITERLVHALDYIRDDIRKVAVRISDDNGPRHGNDKRCLVHVALRNHKEVVVKDIRGDMYTAITHAANRTAHSVKRLLRYRHGPRSANNTGSTNRDDAIQAVEVG